MAHPVMLHWIWQSRNARVENKSPGFRGTRLSSIQRNQQQPTPNIVFNGVHVYTKIFTFQIIRWYCCLGRCGMRCWSWSTSGMWATINPFRRTIKSLLFKWNHLKLIFEKGFCSFWTAVEWELVLLGGNWCGNQGLPQWFVGTEAGEGSSGWSHFSATAQIQQKTSNEGISPATQPVTR